MGRGELTAVFQIRKTRKKLLDNNFGVDTIERQINSELNSGPEKYIGSNRIDLCGCGSLKQLLSDFHHGQSVLTAIFEQVVLYLFFLMRWCSRVDHAKVFQ